jgi:hypothetical protein
MWFEIRTESDLEVRGESGSELFPYVRMHYDGVRLIGLRQIHAQRSRRLRGGKHKGAKDRGQF